MTRLFLAAVLIAGIVAGARAEDPSAEIGRYAIEPVPALSGVVLIDTATGRSWFSSGFIGRDGGGRAIIWAPNVYRGDKESTGFTPVFQFPPPAPMPETEQVAN